MKTYKAVVEFLETKRDHSPRTREQYERALTYLAKVCPEFPGGPGELRVALNNLGSAWVRLSTWIAWRVFFRWCAEEYSRENPLARVKKPKEPEYEIRGLEPEELERVLAAANQLRDKCIVALAIDSGVRASEFGRLRVADISKETIRLQGKGGKTASVPISAPTHGLLQLLIDQDGEDQGAYLFLGASGAPITRYGVYRIVRRCMDRAGIPGAKRGPHCLRHSLGKNYIASGGDSMLLKRVMRHADIGTTQKYVNLSMGDVIKAHRDHSPLRLPSMGFEELVVDQGISEEMLSPRAKQGEFDRALDEGVGMADRLESLKQAYDDLSKRHGEGVIFLHDTIELVAYLFDSHTHEEDGRILLPPDAVEYLDSFTERIKREVKEHDAEH